MTINNASHGGAVKSSSSSSSDNRSPPSRSSSVGGSGGGKTVTSLRGGGGRKQRHGTARFLLSTILPGCMVLAFLATLGANVALVQQTTAAAAASAGSVSSGAVAAAIQAAQQPVERSANAAIGSSSSSSSSAFDVCQLRRYPHHRYYIHGQPHDAAPEFLSSQTEYIFGEWPVLISDHIHMNHNNHQQHSSKQYVLKTAPQKLCVDQSEWLGEKNGDEKKKTLPFADGTNPSILSVSRIQSHYKQQQQQQQNYHDGFHSLLASFPECAYIITICMTNSQCSWKDSPEQMEEYFLTAHTNPDVVLTLIQLVSHDFRRLAQATLTLQLDAPWGMGKQRKTTTTSTKNGGVPETITPAFDDARLFLFDNKIWVSYREGKLFGYESQVLNPIHWSAVGNNNKKGVQIPRFSAFVKASETTSFCCGRNMALMEDRLKPDKLLSLTWIDPVTVEKVDTTPHVVLRNDHPSAAKQQRRRDLQAAPLKTTKLVTTSTETKHKSHIHGTNAFMVYLEDSQEFLGIGHFHRPNDRKPNPFARFGHHYTHTWFTISALPPYKLTALSPEFVLTISVSGSAKKGNAESDDDAHIIQFLSGLELDGAGGDDSTVVLAYGINDCEAAITTLSMTTVRNMMRPVDSGKQVLDYMQPLRVQTALDAPNVEN